jgi:hypothetical protein
MKYFNEITNMHAYEQMQKDATRENAQTRSKKRRHDIFSASGNKFMLLSLQNIVTGRFEDHFKF